MKHKILEIYTDCYIINDIIYKKNFQIPMINFIVHNKCNNIKSLFLNNKRFGIRIKIRYINET